MPPGFLQRLEAFREMHLPQCPCAWRGIELGRQQRGDVVIGEPLQHFPDNPPDEPWRDSLGRSVDGCDAFEVDAFVGIVFHDFKVGMRNHHVRSAALRLAVNDHALSVREHLLDPRRIEPPQHQPPADGRAAPVFEHHVKHPLRASDAAQLRARDRPTHTNRTLGRIRGELIELPAVLVSTRKMQEQITHRRQPETGKLPCPHLRQEIERDEWRFQIHAPTLRDTALHPQAASFRHRASRCDAGIKKLKGRVWIPELEAG